MKRLLFVLAILISLSFTDSEGDKVYMCKNGVTEVYHKNYYCRAMNKCTHEKVKLTLEEANEKGLRLCGYEK